MLIGDFARLGQVSVRMLRHYDKVGLLRPAHVDPWNSYRSYDPGQLPVLNRIVALRELGFSLEQITDLVGGGLTADQLREVYRRRRAAVEDEMRAASTRLAAVESRLRMIEKENTMPIDHVTKTVPALRLAALRAVLDPATLGEHIGPMFRQAEERFAAAGATPGASVATYEESDAGMNVVVGYACAGEVPAGLEPVEMPAGLAVCGVHLGEMASIGESWQELQRAVVDEGHVMAGPCREIYLRSYPAPEADWVTELQQPVSG